MPQTFTVDPNLRHQPWMAWEATANIYGVGMEPPPPWWRTIRDEVVSRAAALGVSRVRLEIADESDLRLWGATGYNWARFDRLITEIVKPLAIAAPGLEVNVCNVAFGSGKVANHPHLDPVKFGEYVVAGVERALSHGLSVETYEVCLEPDKVNGLTIFNTPAKMAGGILAARRALDAAGHTGVGLVAPSCVNTQTAANWIVILRDQYPEAFAAVDVLTYHLYASNAVSTIQQIGKVQAATGKLTGQTEYLSADADRLYKDIVHGRVSVWQKYGLCSHAENPQTQYRSAGLFRLSLPPTGAPVLSESPQTPAMRQYFAFVRPGMTRCGVTGGAATAWRDAAGRVVVILQSVPTVFDIVGIPAGRYVVSYATASGNAVLGSFSVVGKLSVTKPAACSGPMTIVAKA